MFTCLEMVCAISCIWLMICKNDTWLRANYVLIFCGVIICFAFDSGWISKFLGCKISRLFSSIQFEFFIMHQAIILVFTWKLQSVIGSTIITNIILFVVILACAVLYKKYLGDSFSKLLYISFQRILQKIWKWRW